MALHFHPLKVKQVRRETTDCVSVSFDIPDQLKEEFKFQHGQNITIKKEFHGEEARRSYSICTSPFDNELRVAIKKVDQGLFSTYANIELKKGDVLEVMPPTGKFNTQLSPLNKKCYAAFAAGSGITPILSIIKTTLQTEPQSEFTLVYGNRSRSSIIFFEELEALKNKFIRRFNFINILSREKTDAPINFGRISPEKLQDLDNLINYKNIDEFFLCGPEEMIFCIKNFIEEQGISNDHIHFELFTSPDTAAIKKVRSETQKDNTAKSNITIKVDGRTFEFDLPMNSNSSILDAALHQGADLPFACKGGVCCTCKARLTEGEVDMDVNWGLEHEEVKQGYILTCQAHPKTQKIVVDFDIK
ncbi:phenylacetate-CoA oxygenase/reductase subunit PaaK [soil metagenome]